MSSAEKVQRLESMLVRVLARKDITRIRPQAATAAPAVRPVVSKPSALEALMGPAMDLGADDLSEVPTSLIRGREPLSDELLAAPEPAFQIEARVQPVEARKPIAEQPAPPEAPLPPEAPAPPEPLPLLSEDTPDLPLAIDEPAPELIEVPDEPAPELIEVPAEPAAELIEVPDEPAAELIEVPDEPAPELIEVPDEPAPELIEVPDEPAAELIEVPDEPAAELIEVPAEPAPELIEVPAEPAPELIEVPDEPAAELIEVPAEPAPELIEVPAEPAPELIEVPAEPAPELIEVAAEPAPELIEVPAEPARTTIEPEEFDLPVHPDEPAVPVIRTPPPPLPIAREPSLEAQRILDSIPVPKEPESLKPPRDSTPAPEGLRAEIFAPAALPEMPEYLSVVTAHPQERPKTLRGMIERALSLRPRR